MPRSFVISNLDCGLADLRVRANTEDIEPATFAYFSSESMNEATSQIPVLSAEEQKKLVDDAIERLDRLAESQLEMAQLFLNRGKLEIARRRLEEVVELYGKSEAAKDAKKLLKKL